MNQWDESEALGLLIQGKKDQTANLDNVELVFRGDRFNLSPLACTLVNSTQGILTPAVINVFNIQRKFNRKPKSYNKEKINAETAESRLDGSMDVDKTSATFVAKLVRCGYDQTGFLLQVAIENGKLIEFILDLEKLDVKLKSWGCTREDFWLANRENRGVKFKEKKAEKKVSRYMTGKRQRVLASARSYTIHLVKGEIFIKNWCIPIWREDDNDDAEVKSKSGVVLKMTNRTNRIRKLQQDRNRYSVLSNEAVEYGM